MQSELDKIEPIADTSPIQPVDLVRQEYERKAAQKGIGILKELSASEERQDYFGNPLEFVESLTGLLRESLDRSITSEAYYDIESEYFRADKDSPEITEEQFKTDPNIFREGIKYHAGYSYQWHANRAQRYDERREAEEVGRYASGWQKTMRFIAGMGLDLITDPIPNLATGGVGAAFAKTISRAFLAAGVENLVLDEIIDFFKADRLIDEGERAKTFEERNIERAGAFLLGGALGAGIKAAPNIYNTAKKKLLPESEVLNQMQLDPKNFKENIDPTVTRKLSTEEASDKVMDLNKAMQQMQATESLDSKKLSSLENISSFLKSNEALISRLGKIERIELPKEFKVPFSSNTLEVNYKVIDLELLIKSNELDGKIDKLYPAELAPEAKTGAKDIDLVKSIGDNLNPEELLLSNNLTKGAPLIDKENIVIKGNNRVNGLEYAYGIQNAGEYTNALARMFPQYDINGMTKPMLVREIASELSPGELKQLKNLKEDTLNTQELRPRKEIDPEMADVELEKALLGKEARPDFEKEVQLSPENMVPEHIDPSIEKNLLPEYREEFKQALEFEKQLGEAYKNVLNCIRK